MSGTKVQHKETMITSIAWVPVGVPTENPRRAEVPDEDLDTAFMLAGGLEGESDRSDSDERDASCSEGNDEAKLSDERRTFNTSTTEKARNVTGNYSRLRDLSPPARTLGAGLDEAMAALNMEKYDDEDDAHTRAARLFGAGRTTFYVNNDDDPYITIKDDEDVFEEDYPDDFTIRHTDLVLLAARTDVDVVISKFMFMKKPF